MTSFTMFGGSTAQRAAAQDTWDNATYPRGWFEGHNVKLTFDPDASNAMTGAGGHIVMSGQALVEDVWWMMLHEVGHLADFWCLTDSGRAEVMASLGRTSWDEPSIEAWAQSFPLAFMPPDRGYGYPHYPVPVSLVRSLMLDCSPAAAPRFSDVPLGHPYYDAIEWAATSGITVGYPDGTYRPDDPVTRDEMAVFLQRVSEQ